MRGSSIPAPGTKQGSHAKLSEEIKKHTSIPIATVGRITEPWIADELIANGKADICMIGRANLCDSEFANKAEKGMDNDIRPCIGCLRCLNGIMFGKRVACTINPSLEIENEEKNSCYWWRTCWYGSSLCCKEKRSSCSPLRSK